MDYPARFARSLVSRASGYRPGCRSGAACRATFVVGLGAVLAATTLGVSGCKLVDQRTFDSGANRKPVPILPPPPPAAKPMPPLAVVRFGAPPESWQPELAAIVRQALARKPDALFTVQTVVPDTGGADQQAGAMRQAVRDGGVPVAQTIGGAGASSAQINMTATTGSVPVAEIRVTVR